MTSTSTTIELGYIEDFPKLTNTSTFLTSYVHPECALASAPYNHWDAGKIGGRPVWLTSAHIPTAGKARCGQCGKLMKFLCQIYAPVEHGIDHDQAYHRALYIWVCRDGQCLNSGGPSAPSTTPAHGATGPVLVIRQQLPCENAVWPADGDDPACPASSVPADSLPALCVVCGLRADSSLAASAPACCAQHAELVAKRAAVIDKLPADARDTAAAAIEPAAAPAHLASARGLPVPASILPATAIYPEHDLVTETEPEEAAREAAAAVRLGGAAAAPVAQLPEPTPDGHEGEPTWDGLEQADLNEATGAARDAGMDEVLMAFHERVAVEPDQILRYARWQAEPPLWCCTPGRLEREAPACARCGAPRAFEMQVMPQLLSALGGDDAVEAAAAIGKGAQSEAVAHALDFGTIAVYTCTGSCVQEDCEAVEFAWVQPSM